jgi:hypothetical protein
LHLLLVTGEFLLQVNYTDECYFNQSFTDDMVHTLFSSYKYSGEHPIREKSRTKTSNSKSANTKDATSDGSDTKALGKPWYLGLKMNGAVMKGFKTDKNKKNVWFLPKRRTDVVLQNDSLRHEMPTPQPNANGNSPFIVGHVRPKGTSQRGIDSPFTSDGRARSSRGRKRKCHERLVFPVLDGCRQGGRQGGRHRHGSSGRRRGEGSRKRTKPRKRHRQQKSARLFR